MFDERVRAALPRTLGPVARALAGFGVSPHLITWVAFIGGAGAASLVAVGWPLSGLTLWLFSRLGDALDGLVAREAGRASAAGGYLDITLDMAAYSLMVLGFAVAHPGLGLVFGAILTGYTLAITTTLALSNAATAAGREVSRTDRTFQFTTGLAEAGETSFMYTLWVLFPGWLPVLAWIWVALLLITVVQRSRLAWRVLR
jgi:phosphatidylglycerophosphate synthase